MKYNMRISPVDDCVWINSEATLMIDGDTPEEARQAAMILDNHSQLTEENAKLREALEKSSEVLRRQLSQYYYKDEVTMINQYESNKRLLNQLKDQNNDK